MIYEQRHFIIVIAFPMKMNCCELNACLYFHCCFFPSCYKTFLKGLLKYVCLKIKSLFAATIQKYLYLQNMVQALNAIVKSKLIFYIEELLEVEIIF